jgi:hypothetical protein
MRDKRYNHDLRFALLIAAALAVVTSIPYVVGVAMSAPQSSFDGVLVFEPDMNCYLSYMHQASHGLFLFHNPFTPEPHGNVLFNLEWLLGGWIAALPGSSPEIAFHVLRLAAIFGLCVIVSRLCSEFFSTKLMRRLVLVAITTGGGFGWVLLWPRTAALLGNVAFLDTYAGLHPFFWMMLEPHFALGQVCAVAALVQFLRAERNGSARSYVGAGLVVALTGSIRPFDMLYLLTAFSLYLFGAVLVVRREHGSGLLLRRGLAILVPLPLLAYYYWLFRWHPVFRWWSIQNIVPPPDPVSLALSLGLLTLLLLASLRRPGDLAGNGCNRLLMASAAVASVAIVYSYPLLTFTMQALTTLVIPAMFVAVRRLEPAVVRLGRRPAGVLLVSAVVALNATSSAVLLAGKIQWVAAGQARTPRELASAYRWFEDHAGAREVIMAARESANRIPRYSLATTFDGYHFATVDAAAKDRMVRAFYSADTRDAERLALVSRYGIRYVFHGAAERALGTWDPAGAPWLTEVFHNSAAVIYKCGLPAVEAPKVPTQTVPLLKRYLVIVSPWAKRGHYNQVPFERVSRRSRPAAGCERWLSVRGGAI